MSIFERASREQLRWQTERGVLSIEDLWHLNLTSSQSGVLTLDRLAQGLHKKVSTDATVSFVDDAPSVNDADKLRFDIVLHIIKVRKAERTAALEAKDRAEKKQKIMALLAKHQDAALEAKSEEDLKKMLSEL